MIVKKSNDFSLDLFINSKFISKKFNYVLSARQGLNIIYHQLYHQCGKCRVAVSPLTCFEALYPILKNNHEIVFVDIDPNSLNMDISCIPDNVDIIQPIHLGGNPMDMEKVAELSRDINAIVVEDCAQALGSQYNGYNVGLLSDFAVFNFVKNMYALGGGFIISSIEFNMPKLKPIGNIGTLYRVIKRRLESINYRNTYVAQFLLTTLISLKPESSKKVYNNRTINRIIYKSVTNQLSEYENILCNRIKNAKYILSRINNFKSQKVLPLAKTNYTRLFFILKKNTRYAIHKLRRKGIWANHLTQDTLKTYQESVFQNGDFRKFALKGCNLTNYKILHDRILSIPISPVLKRDEMDYIINEINNL